MEEIKENQKVIDETLKSDLTSLDSITISETTKEILKLKIELANIFSRTEDLYSKTFEEPKQLAGLEDAFIQFDEALSGFLTEHIKGVFEESGYTQL